MTVTWQTDPILFDSKTLPSSSWLTANVLITQGKKGHIFHPASILNLYPIMVRKVDFSSSERLLQTMPYLVLNTNWSLKLRKQSLLVAERCYYYFANSPADFSIRQWQRKIIQYCEQQQRIPLPIFRLMDNWTNYFQNKELVLFQSSRGELFTMPTRLTQDLAYLLGVIIGDGHLNYYNVVLVDFSKKNIQMLQTIGKQLFGIEGAISGEENTWLLHLNNKWVVRLINFLTDQPITGKKYDSLSEPLIFQQNEKLRWQFWSGVLDADGCYKRQISFCSSSESFVKAFAKLLAEYHIQYFIRKITTELGEGYILRTKTISKKRIGQLLQPRHPIKLADFQDYINSKTYRPRKDRTDVITTRLRANRNLKFHSYNKSAIITEEENDYFDFSLLPHLGVLNCQKLLKLLRETKGWTQQQLADFLVISKERLASFEYGSAFPINLLRKLLPLFVEQPRSLMLFLEKNKLNFYRSRKTVARLDLQPNDYLLSLIRHFELRNKYLLINYLEADVEKFYQKLSEYFHISHPRSNRLTNSVLHQYAKTFFVF